MTMKVSYELSGKIKLVVAGAMNDEMAQVVIQYITDLERENVMLENRIGKTNIEKYKIMVTEKENDNE